MKKITKIHYELEKMLKIDDIQSAMVTFLTWVEINENLPLMSKNVMGAFSTQESKKKLQP